MKSFTNIEDLIENINATDKSIKQIILVSNTDTIKNSKYFEIKSVIQQTKNMHLVATRKVTNDEILAIQNNYVIQGLNEKPIDNMR